MWNFQNQQNTLNEYYGFGLQIITNVRIWEQLPVNIRIISTNSIIIQTANVNVMSATCRTWEISKPPPTSSTDGADVIRVERDKYGPTIWMMMMNDWWMTAWWTKNAAFWISRLQLLRLYLGDGSVDYLPVKKSGIKNRRKKTNEVLYLIFITICVILQVAI